MRFTGKNGYQHFFQNSLPPSETSEISDISKTPQKKTLCTILSIHHTRCLFTNDYFNFFSSAFFAFRSALRKVRFSSREAILHCETLLDRGLLINERGEVVVDHSDFSGSLILGTLGTRHRCTLSVSFLLCIKYIAGTGRNQDAVLVYMAIRASVRHTLINSPELTPSGFLNTRLK